MRCDLCNGTRCKIIGSIPFRSKPLGEIIVPNIEYSKCRNCDDISIDHNEALKINNYVQAKENEAISSLPIKDFITLNDAADILGITKQAFSKNPRIQRGFIYSVSIDKNKRLYYKKSVEEFKRTKKDGRINIYLHVCSLDIKQLYANSIIPIGSAIPFYSVDKLNPAYIHKMFTKTKQVKYNVFPCQTIH